MNFFYENDVIIMTSVYIERSQLVQYFAHSFTTCQVLYVIARKWITERCSLWDAFSGSVAIFIIELNCVQNLYFGFFIFWKLTELCLLVIYLSDDRRIFSETQITVNFLQKQFFCINDI